jgi:hypothetical protein
MSESHVSVSGDFCRNVMFPLEGTPRATGCSGKGRPSCQAPECIYGAEPCPNHACNSFKAEGPSACAFCGWKP